MSKKNQASSLERPIDVALAILTIIIFGSVVAASFIYFATA